ncbi:restriction endonuclease [Psittacicella melopsittaci]|uniref:Restriction endonuclease n=1 Tax=Psittacicella melopsittaci TaxID=2028576 RepID=A0A3A1Y0R3_9GAMM|nr:HpaII family restriction endonuclease [Psittacicella melopsittaci]RIY31833.1 restriction endonuclease [Psittacicella melopsittaci]
MIKGNKGEWSEIYVLLKLLAEGKIYAADSNLNKIKDIYFPIIKIIREETRGECLEYFAGETITIYHNGTKVKELSANVFKQENESLLNELKCKSAKGAFAVENTETFMKGILCYKLSAPAVDKSDISIKIVDVNTGYSPTVGFSIKSELGSAPTLLNAGKTTNFIYELTDSHPDLVKEINSIYKVSGGKNHTDVKGRINRLSEKGVSLTYNKMNNQVFTDNLVLIDSNMDKIISQTLLYFYRDGISNCDEIVEKLEQDNPMSYGNVNAYRYKFKKFLTAVALGMKPATVWDGVDEATGGYIVVTKEGNVLAYHIYNRNYFEEYLLKSTKYETASTSRHEFGEVYRESDKNFINLNLQIRFK